MEDLRGCIRQSVAKDWGRFWEHMLETELHLAASDLPAAEQAFAHAWSLAPEHRALNAELITRARLRARGGDRGAAIDAYREVLSPRVHLMWGTVVENTLIRYDLARLEEEAGDVAAARDHYREFLGYWGETDLPVPAAEEARARLAALER